MARQNLKEQVKPVWAACKRFVVKWWFWILVVLVLISVLIVLIYRGYWVSGTGFGGYHDAKGEWQRGKTLWDWLDLLLIPMLLALGGWLLNRAAKEREHKAAKDRSREDALQKYLDAMTKLLNDGLRDPKQDDVKRSIARARTLTVLRQLDGVRKGFVLKFLYESELVGEVAEDGAERKETVVSLGEADLNSADLFYANLRGADLCEAELRWANLRGADLRWANLQRIRLTFAHLHKAELRWANLRGAYLTGADLTDAKLRGADLTDAHLGSADLTDANLRAADLTDAYLAGAKVTKAQLDQAVTYEGATLPDDMESTSEAEPSPAEPEPQDAGGQPDQPGDLDAGESVQETD